jgi:hypothetical protein
MDDDGYQYLEIGGKPSRVSRRGQPFSSIAAMGEVTREEGTPNPRRKYGEDVPLGAMDARERVQRLDLEGLDAAIIYPSLGLSWETECEDV